ncbi:(2Fe-2S)-binding protein [Candidatus Mycobacterium methanotrophicum]|uniref:(2Fe-2S)-binding protein n=1 Tax=Candidatus Mycobacterium methanotrophicum TaxID=2943498 RepID=A0ABY4QKG4_9MYCO|nr:(2Fe-2S)-binding protein [Candidatus Mycobacterium methanotrophicum]UQX11339.1 (2Fe-2S)-binding protein [Candidatus Mycobacterium methanotrophicum]
MFACLCDGITGQAADAVADGASTTNQIATSCGAGADCGRCRHALRSLIAACCHLEKSAGPVRSTDSAHRGAARPPR